MITQNKQENGTSNRLSQQVHSGDWREGADQHQAETNQKNNGLHSLIQIIAAQGNSSIVYKIIAKSCIVRDRDLQNFTVPGTGTDQTVRFDSLSCRPWRIYNRSLVKRITESEARLSREFTVIIKVRNILFLDAMLFIQVNGDDVYRLETTDGPFYLNLPDEQFRRIWKQLMKIEE